MPSFFKIKPISTSSLEKIGFTWHTDIDREYAIKEKLISITKAEIEAYYQASNELYKMYEAGAEYVIKNNLFDKLDIPDCLVQSIKKSWEKERNNHLYGRFDLSGGIDGRPIKLIEFNADTPTLLMESTLVQFMFLKENNLHNTEQFNNIYESISKKFKAISKSKKGEYSPFLFACVEGNEEEEKTTKLLQKMADDAGLITNFLYLEDVDIDNRYDFFFKLYPWEDMSDFRADKNTCMLNPAYTLLYQSKGMLAILYELFPSSAYLLEASFSPLKTKYVKKRMFGREGANIDIVNTNGKITLSTDGIYDEYQAVYQEYADFVRDEDGHYYQAGVFYSDGACGLGFRRGAEILDNMSQFIGHIVTAD